MWPTYRRNYYGTLSLERAATDRARIWNSGRVELFLHDVDDFSRDTLPGPRLLSESGVLFAVGQVRTA